MERWHYRMLNDRVRNNAYSRAILKKMSQHLNNNNNNRSSLRILDVGSGTGLLSALCLNHKIDLNIENFRLYACEQSELLYQVCNKYLSSFNMYKYLKVLNKHSSDLKKNEDILTPIDLIVTEIFDDGLLGEGCLKTFYDLFYEQKLLNVNDNSQKKSKIIPQSACVYLAPIESEFLRKSNYFEEKFGNVIIRANCLDNSLKFDQHFDDENSSIYEPYTTENMNQIIFRFLSDPIRLDDFNIRFDEKNLLEKICKRDESIEIQKKIQVKNEGILDAYLLWFDLNLDDEISITNSPFLNKLKPDQTEISECWQHAVYNLNYFKQVKQGEILDLNVKMRSDCFLVKSENKNTEILNEEASLELNRVEIGLLNNIEYQMFYLEWFQSQVLKRIQQNSSKSKIKIGFLTNTFSVLFFKLVYEYSDKISLNLFINNNSESGDSSSSSNNDQNSFMNLIEKHFRNFECLTINYLNNGVFFEARANNMQNRFDLDYLIYEPVDYRFGILKKNLISDLILIKSCARNGKGKT
jgi:type II protein arginine methyltransferase